MAHEVERVPAKGQPPKPTTKRPQSAEPRLSRTATQLQSGTGAPVAGNVKSPVSEFVAFKDTQWGVSTAQPGPRLQTKVTIGTVNSPLEQEADATADRVMRMTDPNTPRPAPPQRNAVLKGNTTAPASVHDVLASPGRPLEDKTRAYFEPRFEQDFSHVRVHVDSGAAQSARSIQARAYTAGHHVVFASGAYAPDTDGGRRLIAHELTHVLQQSGTARASTPDVQRNADDDLTRDRVRYLKEYVATHASPYKEVIGTIRYSAKQDLDDNVSADFTASLSLAQLEKFASLAEGREMLDVLYKAMKSGSVSTQDALQSSRILYANWKHNPMEVFRTARLRDPDLPEGAKFPVVPDFTESTIIKDVNKIDKFAQSKQYGDVIKIVRQAGSLDDDIASRFLNLQSPDRLEAFATTNDGRAMLDVFYEALITGDVTGFQRIQADRILLAKSKTGRPPTAADVTKALDPPVFPLATGWDSTATIVAGLTQNGKVKVYYDSRNGLGRDEFKEERKKLRDRYDDSEIFHGILLEPDELVIVKLFDQGGATATVPAIQLIDFFNQQKEDTLGKIKMVSVMGATVGLGGVGAGGILGWADTIAFAIQTGTLFIQANRDVIAKTAFGRDFLKAWDVAAGVAEYYGWGRLGVDGLRLVHGAVSSPLRRWQDEVGEGLAPAERETIATAQQQAEEWLDAVKQAEAAEVERIRKSISQTTTGYSKPVPPVEEGMASMASRTRSSPGAINRTKGARPFNAKPVGGRSLGSPSTRKGVRLDPKAAKRAGLTPEEVKIVEGAFTKYADQMKKLEAKGLAPDQASAKAHRATQSEFTGPDFPNVTAEDPTGITVGGKKTSNLKTSDLQIGRQGKDPTKPRDWIAAVLEFKRTAGLKEGDLIVKGRDFNIKTGLTNEQVDAYRVLAQEQGIPVFVADSKGNVFAPHGKGEWIKVGGYIK